MATEHWALDGGVYALYTENQEIARAAKKAGLRPAGEYFRHDPFSEPFAWQFVGPKEKVLALVRQAREIERERKRREAQSKAVEKTCPACGEGFEPDNPRQKYCRRCGNPRERARRACEKECANGLG